MSREISAIHLTAAAMCGDNTDSRVVPRYPRRRFPQRALTPGHETLIARSDDMLFEGVGLSRERASRQNTLWRENTLWKPTCFILPKLFIWTVSRHVCLSLSLQSAAEYYSQDSPVDTGRASNREG